MGAIATTGGGDSITTIALQTRLGKDIDNCQAWQVSRFEWSQLSDTLERFRPPFAMALPESACPVYNCHGLTFGSRRTAVRCSNETIGSILEDDGFTETPRREVRVGDIVVYYDERGEVQHSGIVVEIIPAQTKGMLNSPKIWSKWGKGHEFLHHVSACPYPSGFVKFYRMKPWQRGR